MHSIYQLHCMNCGCRYREDRSRHHCRNCFADANYLRVLGVAHPLDLAPNDRPTPKVAAAS